MPHFDKRSGELVIRIVYDGAPEAGKTTNVYKLCSQISLQRRGVMQSPGTTERRTEFFDWLDFSGGFIDGQRVRCQLVSVPGQPRLLHRRKYLLETADAIVFVADSRRQCANDSKSNLATTRRILQAQAAQIPVGIVVQANKQDLAETLLPAELASALELPSSVPVVASTATTGEGVMETFILAVRLATDRVRALLYDDGLPNLPVDHETPSALHEALQTLSEERDDHLPVASEAPSLQFGTLVPRSRDRRPNPPPAGVLSAIGADIEVSAGHVWPPVKGRALLATVDFSGLFLPEFMVSWAPVGAFELRTRGGWVFHSSERWLFGTEAEARLKLLSIVRRQVARAELLPDSRAVFLCSQASGYRLWVMTRNHQSLRDLFVDSLRRRDAAKIRSIYEYARRFVEQLALIDASGEARLPGGAGAISGEPDGAVILAFGDDSSDDERDLRDPYEDLRREAIELGQTEPGLIDWIAAEKILADPA